MSALNGKTILVTGAAQGIGRALALAIQDAGSNLVLVDIAEDALASTAAELEARRGNVLSRTMDITGSKAVEELRAVAESRFGCVDALVNNAAIGPEKVSPRYLVEKPKFWDVPDHLWLAMLRVNVFGAQLMSRTFAPAMISRKWGRIINITTSLDTMFRQGVGCYGPCKAALEAASRIMAQDLEGTGVTANVLVPGGPVNTRMVPADCGLPQDGLIQPEQMCAPLVWLCSEEANSINGIRVIAQKWKSDHPVEQRLAEATAPIAWPQLGAQSLFPQHAES